MTNGNPVVFFDGVCNLCNTSVQFIIRRDEKDIFRFASLQSDFAQKFFNQKQYITNTDSIVLFYKNKFYTQSTAVLIVASILPLPTRLLYIFILIPAFLRNPVYNIIAKNRYRWFGRKESCMVPSTNLMHKFIDI